MVVKKIFRYRKETKDFGLWYPKGNEISLVTYIDAYWEGSIDDRRSTSGANFYLFDCLVSWLNKKQSSIYFSTTKVEYCYEENLSMARGKPQQMEMTAEINSNLRYAI
jgi:hypothetical protein